MDNNRQIKFRAWDGSLMYYDVWIVNGKAYSSDDGYYELFSDREVMFCKSIEQFTGLTDKEGKEIYEGDLLTRDLGVKWKVEFTERGWRAVSFNHTGLYLDPEQFVECKIVGTIHQ